MDADKRSAAKNTVTVTVDRAIGTCHPEYPDIPVKQFTGRVIAVVHRYDDKEEKWVVAPENQTFSMDHIKKEIHFQEQYFDSEVIMLDT